MILYKDNSREHLIAILDEWMEKKKVGSILINFFKGGIPNIIKNESQKLNKNFHNLKNEVEKNGTVKTENQRHNPANNAQQSNRESPEQIFKSP